MNTEMNASRTAGDSYSMKSIDCQKQSIVTERGDETIPTDLNVETEKTGQFSDFPEEFKSHVLTIVKEIDLFECQEIPEQLNEISDSILESRGDTLSVSRSVSQNETFYDAREKLISMITSFSNGNRLELRYTHQSPVCISFDELLRICKQNIRKVESLFIEDKDFNAINYHLLIDCFPHLKHIFLKSLDLNDEHVSHLFLALPQLQSISLLNLDISGECFKDIGEFVNSIEWSHAGNTVVADFPFSANLRNFQFIAEESVDGGPLLKMISEKMVNLEKLGIRCYKISDFSHLYLNSLKELILSVYNINGIASTKQMASLKSLELNTISNTEDVIELLSKFPCIEIVTVESSCCSLLTPNLIASFSGLRSLQTLRFTDIIETEHDYMFDMDGVQKNGLVALIEAMKSIQETVFVIKCRKSVDSYSRLVKESKAIAEKQRRKQSISLFFYDDQFDY